MSGFDPSRFDRRRTPARADLAAEHLRGRIAAARYTAGRPVRVGVEVADLLQAPDAAAPRETQALYGEEATLYDEAAGWSWIQLAGDGYVGYAATSALRPPDAHAPTHVVCATRTFAYAEPSIKSEVRKALPLGAKLRCAEEEGPFRVSEAGFLFCAHLAPLDGMEQDYVAVAERFLNAPYLWGGKTWLGMDCSGLVQVALSRAGVTAPRDTDMQQAELGKAIDPQSAPLQRGDLVFWAGHVGVMQDAERLLHANGHHMAVRSEPFAEAARRIAAGAGGEVAAVRRFA